MSRRPCCNADSVRRADAQNALAIADKYHLLARVAASDSVLFAALSAAPAGAIAPPNVVAQLEAWRPRTSDLHEAASLEVDLVVGPATAPPAPAHRSRAAQTWFQETRDTMLRVAQRWRYRSEADKVRVCVCHICVCQTCVCERALVHAVCVRTD